MKFSDEVAIILKKHTKVVFGITGGAVINILDSIHKYGPTLIPMHHEQACAMAADAYARLTGFGCCIGTSGPGATNLVTGTCCSWFDSIPVLTIAGQVPSSQLKRKSHLPYVSEVRQNGFQETDTITLFSSIVKNSRYLQNLDDLEESINICMEDRKGPTFLEFCDDTQRKIS